ncbi:MAG TPA: hypothetical protein VJK53_05670 [Candidatus Paceibacterota bacterium]
MDNKIVLWVVGALVIGGIAGFYMGGAGADSAKGVSQDDMRMSAGMMQDNGGMMLQMGQMMMEAGGMMQSASSTSAQMSQMGLELQQMGGQGQTAGQEMSDHGGSVMRMMGQ